MQLLDKNRVPIRTISKAEFVKRLSPQKPTAKVQQPAVSNEEFLKNLSNKGSKKMATKTENAKKMKDAILKKVIEALGEIPTKVIGTNEIGLKVDGAYYTLKLTQKKTEIEGL